MLKLRYKHVLFDLDGTIYDSLYANTAALYDLLIKERGSTTETVDSLYRYAATPAYESLISLGFKSEDYQRLIKIWCHGVIRYGSNVKPFDGMLSVLSYLKNAGCALGIITSRDRESAAMIGPFAAPIPPELSLYFKIAICSSDVENPKPAPDSILKYMNITGAKREEILYIGDTLADFECARDSGVDFGLAVWGSHMQQSISCAHYFLSPWDIVNAISALDPYHEQWFLWAHEIQAIGQIGLAYTKDKFDRERFIRLREIAQEIMQTHLDVPVEKLKESFLFDKGYPTPKLDTRGAVFNDKNEILMVKETMSGLWNLPGGWCDENETIFSNTLKEVLEEAGMQVSPVKLIALVDRNRHNTPPFPYGVLKAFVLCKMGPQHYVSQSDETVECGFFSKEAIKELNLRNETNTYEQLLMCFEAHESSSWVTIVE